MGGWSLASMLWAVPYLAWDIGRGILFLAFALALTVLAAAEARGRASLARSLGAVLAAYLAAAAVALLIYAIVTKVFRDRIVQLPEYLRDYTYHGHTSPAAYLAENYADLFRLQVLSWILAGLALITIAGSVGWALGRVQSRSRAA